MSNNSLEFHQFVKATPNQAFFAWTNATALKEWFCDIATLDPKPGGRFYSAWNSGYYAAGEFTIVEPEKKVAFTWYGRNEPAPTLVEIILTESGDGTMIKVLHSGIGEGEAWAGTREEIEKGWGDSLENLASVLETGRDLRLVLRPMLGIGLNDFNAEVAKQLSVPVSQGIRLETTFEGMGAQAAGLQKDDVLVSLGGEPVLDYNSLANALQGHRAGDKVEVVFYRGAEKKSVEMELSHRRIPDIPATIQELAAEFKKRRIALEEELEAFFAGVSENEASFKPAPNEWSIKEVVAHLIQGEQAWHQSLADSVEGQERWSDDYGGNLQSWIDATVSAYPTLVKLIEEWKRCSAVSQAFLSNIPADFVEKRKGTYWRIAYGTLEVPFHEHGHLEQMQEALKASRETQ